MSFSHLSRTFAVLPRPRLSLRSLCTGAASPSAASPSSSAQPSLQDALHAAVLAQVPTHGWTPAAIAAAVDALGWSPASARALPRGPVQALERFVRRCDEALAARLHAAPEPSRAPDRAAFAIRERLQMQERFHDQWKDAIALQMLPRNVALALSERALLVDEIAHFAGYRKPDLSWYTDRAVLGLAYHSTELYWLTDKSPGREDTWQFLETRLNDSHALRSQAASAYSSLMTLSDATLGSISTLIRSTRTSY